MINQKFWNNLLTGFILLSLLVLATWLIHSESEIASHERQIVELLKRPVEPETPETPEPKLTEAMPKSDGHTIEHAAMISRIEAEVGVPLSRIAMLIIQDEGKRTRPYLDGGGNVTIGVGRSLKTNGVSAAELHMLVDAIDYRLVLSETSVRNGRVYISTLKLAEQIFSKPLSQADIQLLLVHDLGIVVKQVKGFFPKVWPELDPVRKEVLVDIVFNLGLPHFKTFENFIGAVRVQDWTVAASELLRSKAARQNKDRYRNNAVVLLTGKF